MSAPTTAATFSKYEKLVIFMLSITQFTVVLDFMVMSPLGDLLVKSLDINVSSFGVVVSAYAFSAGFSGLLTAGFADKYDRKKLLVFFYTGFIIGTFCCGLANSYETLVAARIFTGLFGGVIGSISMAIVTDLFPLEKRGRVMSFIQMGFGASQVMGIPIGLYIANRLGWEAPFLFIASFAVIILLIILKFLQPVTAHLFIKNERSFINHLLHTLKSADYRVGFITISFLTLGGFMMMPYGTIFAVNNLGVHPDQLPVLFMVSGVCSLLIMPFVGKLSDRINKLTLFIIGTIWLVIVCLLYTHLYAIPFIWVLVLNILLMIGIVSRMVPSTALISAIPENRDRGAYMSIHSSLQQIFGGVAAAVAGMIVFQETKTSPLENYNVIGYIVTVSSILTIYMMTKISHLIRKKQELKPLNTPEIQDENAI